MRNVYAIATSFFFIFFGFGTAQQYLVVLFSAQGRAHLALTALLILYAAFLVTGMMVPRFVRTLGGLKRSLILGALTYALFTASVAVDSALLLIAAAALLGIGAGFLWVTSGKIITDSAPPDRVSQGLSYQVIGMYTGNILGVFAGGHIVKLTSLESMYLLLAVVILLGVAVLFSVKVASEEMVDRPFLLSFTWRPIMLALFPLVFGANYLQAQVFTGINLIVVQFLGIASIPLIVAVIKAANIAGSFSSGSLADKFSKALVLLCLVVIALIGITFFAFTTSLKPFLAGAILLGFSMAAIYPVTLAVLKEVIPSEEYLYALGTFHVYNNLGVLASIGANFILPTSLTLIPGATALLLAIAGIFIFRSLSVVLLSSTAQSASARQDL